MPHAVGSHEVDDSAVERGHELVEDRRADKHPLFSRHVLEEVAEVEIRVEEELFHEPDPEIAEVARDLLDQGRIVVIGIEEGHLPHEVAQAAEEAARVAEEAERVVPPAGSLDILPNPGRSRWVKVPEIQPLIHEPVPIPFVLDGPVDEKRHGPLILEHRTGDAVPPATVAVSGVSDSTFSGNRGQIHWFTRR